MQTFWITDTPERYLARFEAEGVVSELSSIDLGGPQRVENSELGFAVTVPEGWISFFSATQNERNSAILHLVAPELGFAMLSRCTSSTKLIQVRREPHGRSQARQEGDGDGEYLHFSFLARPFLAASNCETMHSNTRADEKD